MGKSKSFWNAEFVILLLGVLGAVLLVAAEEITKRTRTRTIETESLE
jgi:hypothetical protein